MFLNDLKNKEQEHKDIKNILEHDYGYTVKDPIYGNSAKKALQQIKDAKQELYRNFDLEFENAFNNFKGSFKCSITPIKLTISFLFFETKL